MVKYKAYKFDENLVNSDMAVDEIVLRQYFHPLEAPSEIRATDLYMPEEEQDKMADWMMKNQRDFKKIRTKKEKQRSMQWVKLEIFPSEVEDVR